MLSSNINVYSSFIHSSQKPETTWMSVSGWVDESVVLRSSFALQGEIWQCLKTFSFVTKASVGLRVGMLLHIWQYGGQQELLSGPNDLVPRVRNPGVNKLCCIHSVSLPNNTKKWTADICSYTENPQMVTLCESRQTQIHVAPFHLHKF